MRVHKKPSEVAHTHCEATTEPMNPPPTASVLNFSIREESPAVKGLNPKLVNLGMGGGYTADSAIGSIYSKWTSFSAAGAISAVLWQKC
jgi:hypothetical protein